MGRMRQGGPETSQDAVNVALLALSADELREVVVEIMADLDDRARARVEGSIVSWATRGGSGWLPAALGDTGVSEAVAFAEAALRNGYADPPEFDERLLRGVDTFLSKDYAGARRIFGALLPPLVKGEIDLGQDEVVDEVLRVDIRECVMDYVVAVYMTSDPAERAEAVHSAIKGMRGLAYVREPIRELERAAVEPLPGFEDFLSQWRVSLEGVAVGARRSDWDREADGWLREVVARLEGSDGLAHLARSTKDPGDLQGWCESLTAARDWKGALSAFEESAQIVVDSGPARGEFLDGAALAAQELGEKDVSPWFGRAWHAHATLPRLCRWLGAARTRQAVQERATEAVEACPEAALRQRAFLHVLRGDLGPAATQLAEAPGLGWSSDDHPGALIFPLFRMLLGDTDAFRNTRGLSGLGEDIGSGNDRPRLATPGVEHILRQAGVVRVSDAGVREILLTAMRDAAAKRVAGVTEQKRRKAYGHAASLVAACVACDGSPTTGRWVRALQEAYRRFPAFRAELDHRLGSA